MEERLGQLEKQWQDREDELQNQLELKACDLDEDVIEVREDTWGIIIPEGLVRNNYKYAVNFKL